MEDEHGRPGFAAARREAEKEARRSDRETDIGGIYACMDTAYADMRAAETEAEISLAFPDPDAKDLFEKAKLLGKRIVLVSDMYLRSDDIRGILERCGYSGWERILVSCEEKVSKHRGLWKRALDYLGLPPEKVIAVGDSRSSDFEVPSALGIHAFRWAPMTERYLMSHRVEARFARSNPGWQASALVAMDMLMDSRADADEVYWHRVSRRFGGPMCIVFARFVEDSTQGADELLFLSRDGYMPMRVWERLYGGREHVYLRSSRMIAKIFGSADFGDRDTVLSMMEYMRCAGIGCACEASDRQWRLFAAEHRGEMERISAEGRRRYASYVSAAAGSPARAAAIDATTKKFTSQKDLSMYMADTELTGCYYSVTASGGPPHAAYADRSRQHLSSSYVNLAEFFMESGEPALADIDADGKPVLACSRHDPVSVRERAHQHIEAGILECAGVWKEIFGGRIPRIRSDIMDAWMDVLMSEERGNDPDALSGIKWAVDTRHRLARHLIIRWSDVPGLVLYNAASKALSAVSGRKRDRKDRRRKDITKRC